METKPELPVARRHGPGRPRVEVKDMQEQVLTGIGTVLLSFSPQLKELFDRPDLRRRKDRTTYSAGLIRLTMVAWMVLGGASCDAFGAFIANKGVAKAISGLGVTFGYAVCRNGAGDYVLPGIDLLRLEAERMPSEWLADAFCKIAGAVISRGFLDRLRTGGAFLLAVDGTDGFSTTMPSARLLRRTTGGHTRYFSKMLVASAVSPGLGGGVPVGALSVENSGYDEIKGEEKRKQACEQAALPGLLEKLSGIWPLEESILLLDGLYMNGVTIRLMNKYKCGYFITLKDDALDRFHIALDEQFRVDGREFRCRERERVGKKEIIWEYGIAWKNGIRYDFNGEKTPEMNYLYVIVTRYVDGEECWTRKFSWITNVILADEKIPLVQMAARRRWGVETQNYGQKHLGMHLTHKYDSRGFAPANFMYLAQIADLLRKILLYSDFYARQAANAAVCPVLDRGKNKPAKAGSGKRADGGNGGEKKEAGTGGDGGDCPPGGNACVEGREAMGKMLKKLWKWRKDALHACSLKYWTSVAEWCAEAMAAIKNGLEIAAVQTEGFAMRWLMLDSRLCPWKLRWRTE